MMKRLTFPAFTLIASFLLLAVLTSCGPSGPPPVTPGQAWKYQTRPGEEASYLVILKIDSFPDVGKIVHVAIEDVKINNPANPQVTIKRVGHMPFYKEVLESSLVELKQEDPIELPEYEMGYQPWLENFEKGISRAWNVKVDEALSSMEGTVRKNSAAPDEAPAEETAPAEGE